MSNHASTLEAVAEHDAGRLDRAESLYRNTLAHNPNDLAALIGLGDVLSDARQVTEAEQMYRRALEIESATPAVAGAYDGLAAILQDAGDLDNAIIASKKAALLRGDADDAFGVGNSLEFLGRRHDAIDMFVLATQLRPDFSQAHIKAAQLLLMSGRDGESIPHYVAAIESHPQVAELHCNLANARRKTGDCDKALNTARQAIELNPRLADAHNVMGAIWRDRRRPSDAAASFKRALEIKPDHAEAMNNLAGVLAQVGQLEKACEIYTRAVAIQPQVVEYHESLGMNLLLLGHLGRGWREFEWRRLRPGNPGSRQFSSPMWDGSPLAGRTIVLFAEQGFGDTIMFLRYVPEVVARGGRVIIECQAPVAPLAREIPGVAQVLIQGEPWPDRHTQLPLMSLPLILGTELHSIPTPIPYIIPDETKIKSWQARLQSCTGRRVGLVWAGSPTHLNDKIRSIKPERLAPLGEVPGISFVSLQKNAKLAPPENLKLLDLTEGLTDFAETAGLIANLDLVITVDTSVAHLAGAMGKPVWILLPEVPDWRWLLNRTDSPWYPSARLFRQTESRSWGAVIETVAAELRRL